MLGRRAGIALGSQDVYANLAGGLSVVEPALDLPLALALASSARDRAVPVGTVAIGEVGLLGELRVGGRARATAARGGPPRIRIGPSCRAPSGGAAPAPVDGLRIVAVATLRDAIEAALAGGPAPRGEAVPAMLG